MANSRTGFVEDAGITAFLSSFSLDVQAIALRLRALVLEIVPGVTEQTDLPAKMLAYGFAVTYKDTVCVIMPQTRWVNLGFPRGARMNGPAGLLTGTGKRARHVKISSLDDAGKPEVRSLLEQACQMVKGGLH